MMISILSRGTNRNLKKKNNFSITSILHKLVRGIEFWVLEMNTSHSAVDTRASGICTNPRGLIQENKNGAISNYNHTIGH